jgi:two-component system, NarL family, nitrate/nitrite response regulator NarL
VGERIRVLVAADARLARDGLALLIARDGRVTVAGTCATGDDLAGQPGAADVVVLDPGGGDALPAVGRMAVPIVMVNAPEADEEVIAYAEGGVMGFVERDGTLDDLVDCIRCAGRGEASCSPRVSGLLLRRLTSLARPQPVETTGLTSREREVVKLIAEGLANKEIAARLCIEVATVKNHVHNILEKLQVSRRDEAAARLRLVEGVPAVPASPGLGAGAAGSRPSVARSPRSTGLGRPA